MGFLINFHEVHFHKNQLKWKTSVRTALPYDLAITQKLTSKLLYLVGSHFKTLRQMVTSKRCQTIYQADYAGCASHGGCCQRGLQLLCVMQWRSQKESRGGGLYCVLPTFRMQLPCGLPTFGGQRK